MIKVKQYGEMKCNEIEHCASCPLHQFCNCNELKDSSIYEDSTLGEVMELIAVDNKQVYSKAFDLTSTCFSKEMVEEFKKRPVVLNEQQVETEYSNRCVSMEVEFAEGGIVKFEFYSDMICDVVVEVDIKKELERIRELTEFGYIRAVKANPSLVAIIERINLIHQYAEGILMYFKQDEFYKGFEYNYE